MKVINSPAELRQHVVAARRDGKVVGIVPTMGALHAGHVSLAQKSTKQCDFTVATIFLNPTQFAAGEDLEKYPRTMKEDCSQLAAAGIDLVFAPESQIMYPPGYSTAVRPPDIAKILEGEFRPTHFQGVCTIVLKLLNLVCPDKAYFGQKDYQQLAVIRKMVIDLNVPVEIIGCATVRDPDGLALSSRNRYLDDQQREIALSLNKTLEFVEQQVSVGQNDTFELVAEMRQRLIDAGVDSIDYAAIVDPETLQVPESIDSAAVALIAAHVGSTRLIDNRLID